MVEIITLQAHVERPACRITQGVPFPDEALKQGTPVQVVDSDGNIQKPETVDGANISKEEWVAAYEVCGEIIENITFGKEEVDRSEKVDQYVELAACLRS